MIRNYRNKHYTIIAIAATILILSLLPMSTPKFVENMIFIIYIIVISALGIGEKTEKADEFTEFNLAKANKFTMFAALITILAYSFFGDPDTEKDLVTLPSVVFEASFGALLIFRSVVFLLLDRPSADTEEE